MLEKSDYQKICVMGGSFNSPTLAHLQLMLAALDALQADIGLFVPSGQKYVAGKMKRQKCKDRVLVESVRLDMLTAMCNGDERLQMDDLEFGRDNKVRTFETMEAIQRKYPHAELWFIAGCDKLQVIPRWHRSEEFLQQFHILAASRDGASPENALCENPLLNRYKDKFYILAMPESAANISSTYVRDLMRDGDKSAERMVCPAVWDMLLAEGWLSTEITSFRGKYEFLSNFYEAPVEYDGLRYGSAEAAFQAQKCQTEEERQKFQTLRPGEAKKVGRSVPLRPDWEQLKVKVMFGIVRAKFTQNPDLARRLMETGDMPIIEGNTWKDTCWGIDIRTGQGENHLGRILMEVRKELLSQRSCSMSD